MLKQMTQPTPYSERYLWYVVSILTIASTLSFIDRQILNVMIGPIKRDLGGISDTQVSLIMGLAFALFYNFLSYPAGRISDRYNRRNLMVWLLKLMRCRGCGAKFVRVGF